MQAGGRRAAGVVLAGLVAIAAWPGAISRAETLILNPIKDNTLTEDAAGAYSNGTGEGIFAGRLASAGNGRKLRAVLAFNVSAIPPGSVITSASVTLHIAQAVGGNQTHTLHRVLADWGEGTSYGVGGMGSESTPNDATWIHRFWPGTNWTTPGGQFVGVASASKIVGDSGTHTWTSAGLAADVQAWVNNSSANFGWLMRGNEAVMHTAKKFVSREGEEKPILTIQYTPGTPPPCPEDVSQDKQVDIDDLLSVIDAWGLTGGAAGPADVNSSGMVDVDDLLAVINAWGPC